MSYDLYFVGNAGPSQDEFFGYFRDRPCYELNDNQAWYRNEDTGVYFCFDFNVTGDSDPLESDANLGWASFNINYNRPHYFADEALPELKAFVRRFACLVSDPQNDGMGDGEFAPDGFLRGWNSGNKFASKAVASSADTTEPITRPSAELHSIWEWNLRRKSFQKELGEHVFVPRISFFRVAGVVHTASIWADGIPVVLPKTDIVAVYRDELAPKRWFRRRAGLALASWADVMAIIGGFRSQSAPLIHYYAEYRERPEDVAHWVRSLPSAPALEGVSMDSVLDSEALRASDVNPPERNAP